MTPGARVAAAIGVLDRVLAGTPAEQALTNWARANRYAGSGDRAAVRDHVFGAIRCKRSFAALGGAETGRGLMIGALRAAGDDPTLSFTGQGYAPDALGEREVPTLEVDELPEAVQLDVPDWLVAPLQSSLAGDFGRELEILRHRAPVFLRVNRLKADHDSVDALLRGDGIESAPHPLSKMARLVTVGARRIRNADAYRRGLVELQDAASQAVVETLGDVAGLRVLDYCAGGGGKALALAALGAEVSAHDVDAGRMSDLPARAARAGARIARLSTAEALSAAPWPLILVDAPCSGSGAWRRQPEAKWRLDEAGLARLVTTQAEILDTVAPCVASGGRLAYATCSLLQDENGAQVEAFLARHSGWRCVNRQQFLPSDGGDGFFLALFMRDQA